MSCQKKITRIFVDISALREYISGVNRYSGIQRTIVTLASELSRLPENVEIFLTFLGSKETEHYCIAYDQIGFNNLQSAESMRRILLPKSTFRTSIKPLSRYRNKPVKFYFHRLKLDILAALNSDRSFRRYNLTAKMWRQIRSRSTKTARPAVNVIPRKLSECASPGDHFLSMDSTWQRHHTAALRDLKRSGIVIHTFVHDLIPIVAPSTIDGPTCEIFYDWIVGTIDYTDHYIANSSATRTDLIDFLTSCGVGTDVSTVPLAQAGLPELVDEGRIHDHGTDFRAEHRKLYPFFFETLDISGEVRNIAAAPFVLCVGTIEARKNVWRIAIAWKSLLDSGRYDLPRLVFAGRWGSLSKDFKKLMDATGNLNGWVRILEGPSDEELQVLYRHCEFLVMASTYEGWGLPVGEALAYGKTAVVSSVSSLPEVGGDLVEYCDPHSTLSIADAVWRLWSEPERRQALEARISQTTLRSWRAVAEDLYQAMIRAS